MLFGDVSTFGLRVLTRQHSLYGSAKSSVKNRGPSMVVVQFSRMTKTNIPATLIGVPLDLGAENLGVDIGPDAFRYQKIIKKLHSTGFDIQDHGNIQCKERANAII